MVKIAKSSLTMIELKSDQMHHKYVLYTQRAKRPFFLLIIPFTKNSIDHDYYQAKRSPVPHGFPLITINR